LALKTTLRQICFGVRQKFYMMNSSKNNKKGILKIVMKVKRLRIRPRLMLRPRLTRDTHEV
jgi:hypothetical protein